MRRVSDFCRIRIERPKATKAQNNNKTQTQPVVVTLHPTFSHCDFHNKNTGTASEAPLGHRQRYTEQSLRERSAAHETLQRFNVLPPSYAASPLLKATQNNRTAIKWELGGKGKRREKNFKTRVKGSGWFSRSRSG